MYRVFNYLKNEWMDGNFAIDENGNLVVWKKKGIFKRLVVDRYIKDESFFVVDLNTGMRDVDGNEIFEHDILEVGNVKGLVAWDNDLAEYVLLDYENKIYYNLWNKLTEMKARIIGNLETDESLLHKEDERERWEGGSIVQDMSE